MLRTTFSSGENKNKQTNKRTIQHITYLKEILTLKTKGKAIKQTQNVKQAAKNVKTINDNREVQKQTNNINV